MGGQGPSSSRSPGSHTAAALHGWGAGAVHQYLMQQALTARQVPQTAQCEGLGTTTSPGSHVGSAVQHDPPAPAEVTPATAPPPPAFVPPRPPAPTLPAKDPPKLAAPWPPPALPPAAPRPVPLTPSRVAELPVPPKPSASSRDVLPPQAPIVTTTKKEPKALRHMFESFASGMPLARARRSGRGAAHRRHTLCQCTTVRAARPGLKGAHVGAIFRR